MSELHKFLFDGLPVRGMLVRLTDGWQEALRRRAAVGAFAPEVRVLLGEMAAAGVLMQANIKFNGSLVLQIFGDGPVKLAVAEVLPDLSFRSTAKVGGRGACRRAAGGDAQRGRQGPLCHHAGPQGPPARPAALPGRGAAARRPARAAAGRVGRARALHAAVGTTRHPADPGSRRPGGRRAADPAPAGAGRRQPGRRIVGAQRRRHRPERGLQPHCPAGPPR